MPMSFPSEMHDHFHPIASEEELFKCQAEITSLTAPARYCAGSERRKAIGNQGAQTNKEGDAINKSLLTLQTVVMALGSKGVPAFRESKLTHFLKDSIGGNCKTTLLACAWGDPSKMQETLATCRFAEKMMKVAAKHTMRCRQTCLPTWNLLTRFWLAWAKKMHCDTGCSQCKEECRWGTARRVW